MWQILHTYEQRFNVQLKNENPEEKRRELEEAGRQEEKLLAEARRRSGTGPWCFNAHFSKINLISGQASPPPLPSSPPPRDSPPPTSSSNPTPGTARLDMLLGKLLWKRLLILLVKYVNLNPPWSPFSGNGGSRKESPSKRVSFMPPVESREDGEEEEEESDQELEEREESVDREEQDPNVSRLFCFHSFSLWMWILIPVFLKVSPSTQPAFHSHHLERNLMVNLSLCCSRNHFPLHYSSVFRLPSKV